MMITFNVRAATFATIILLSCVLKLSQEADFLEGFKRAKGCSLNFAKDFPDKEPVLLSTASKRYQLIEPRGDAVKITSKADIIVACPGGKNKLTEINQQSASAECVSDHTLSIDGKQFSFTQLGCEKAVTGEFLETSEACGGGRGVIKHIGYNVDGDWYTLFDVCYDNFNGESLYATHVLYGSAISYAKKVNTRPGFKVGGLGPGVAAENAYKQIIEKSTFTTLLGSATLAEKYIHRSSYLARGHMAPDGDFVFVSAQYSTYFYINTLPQWQAINNGNWKSLEFAVRDEAASMKSNFKVITGGHEVLSFPNTKGKATKIYLVSKDKLPVPKFIWKVVYSLDTQNAIAFVSVNNPFKTNITEDDFLCKNICEKYNWGSSSHWDNPAKGFLYCCDVNEFAKVVKTLPPLKVSGILEGKGSFDHIMRNYEEIFNEGTSFA